MALPALARTSQPVTRIDLARVEGLEQLRIALATGERAVWLSKPLAKPRRHAIVRSLSRREIEVLSRVAQGQSNKEIGAAMGLSPLTIKSHLARISKKLGTGNRAGLVAAATRAGLL